MTAVLFFPDSLLHESVDIEADSSMPERSVFTRAEKHQVALNVVANLECWQRKTGESSRNPGSPRSNRRPSNLRNPRSYLSNFGQSISQDGKDTIFRGEYVDPMARQTPRTSSNTRTLKAF